MRINQFGAHFEVKMAGEDGFIEGHGAVFSNIDHGGDKIEPGAFKSWIRGAKSVPMLWQHNADEPIGVWSGFGEDQKGLRIEGKLNLSRDSGSADVPLAWKARSLIKQGAVSGLSIGYYPTERHYDGDVRVLTKVDVVEVSLATFPMNESARVTAVKSALTFKAFERMCRDHLGMSRREAEAVRLHGFEGLKKYARDEVISEPFSTEGSSELEVVEASIDQLLNKLRTKS